VALGPLCSEFNPLYQQWNNDFMVNRATSFMGPVTLEAQVNAFEKCTKDESYVFFTIFDKENLKPIGITYLSNITKRNAEFAIVIGESDYHGKGFGTEATQLTLDYAFTILGLHNVLLKVFEYNQAGINAYKKAGFKEIGRRREIKYLNGKLWDDIYMDCLSTEFESKVLAKMLDL
jgi:RimJ/RimL family protein N-acetyltransferase